MKNSLFKRVFATVASVPLALSQCLIYPSYAVTNDSVQSETGNTDSSEKEAYTLRDNLLYIAPEQVESTWYSAFNAELVAIGNKSNENYIAKDTIANAILKRAGKYSDKAQLIIDMLDEDGVKYTISNTGDVTITGKILNPDISALMDTSKKYSLSETLGSLAEKYNAPGIADIDFSMVDFSGTFEIVIEGSDLAEGHTFDVKAKYTANTPVNGKRVFAVGDLADFALAKIDEIKTIAHLQIDLENLFTGDADSAKAEFDSKFEKAEKWINKAKNNQDRIYTENRTASSPDMAGLIKTLNGYIDSNRYSDKLDPIIDKIENKFDIDLHIPATAADIVANSYVADIFEILMNEINKNTVSYDVQISKEDIATFADNDLYNLYASAEEGTYTLKGDFPDEQVTDSVKHMVATVDAGDIYNADSTLATVGFRIYRDPVTTSSTTTETTTTTDTNSTTTTTSTSDTETETTTTTTETTVSTDDTNTSTETTTTSGTDDTNTSTETTTTSGTDDTNTSTETTTTSGTDDTNTNTETTTTGTTTSGSGIVLNGVVKKWTATVTASDEAGYAFYYSYEEEFERGHIDSVILNVTYDDDKEQNIKIDFDYASTPKETFTKGDLDFKYDVPLLYRGETITDASGKTILSDGDNLTTEDDKNVTFEVYIGYLGDIDFNYKVDAVDASKIATYYARLSVTNEDGSTPTGSDVILSQPDNPSIVVDDPDSIYEQFSAFLADPNQSNGIVTASTNRQASKNIRLIDALDASAIAAYYAALSVNNSPYELGQREPYDALFDGTLQDILANAAN